jgi:hypothetical protein
VNLYDHLDEAWHHLPQNETEVQLHHYKPQNETGSITSL